MPCFDIFSAADTSLQAGDTESAVLLQRSSNVPPRPGPRNQPALMPTSFICPTHQKNEQVDVPVPLGIQPVGIVLPSCIPQRSSA